MTNKIEVNEAENTITCEYHESSNILSTLYHTKTQHLEVVFAKGKRVTYYPVDLDTHRKLMLAESIGKVFVQSVQKNTKLQYHTGDKREFLVEQTKYSNGKIARK